MILPSSREEVSTGQRGKALISCWPLSTVTKMERRTTFISLYVKETGIERSLRTVPKNKEVFYVHFLTMREKQILARPIGIQKENRGKPLFFLEINKKIFLKGAKI